MPRDRNLQSDPAVIYASFHWIRVIVNVGIGEYGVVLRENIEKVNSGDLNDFDQVLVCCSKVKMRS